MDLENVWQTKYSLTFYVFLLSEVMYKTGNRWTYLFPTQNNSDFWNRYPCPIESVLYTVKTGKLIEFVCNVSNVTSLHIDAHVQTNEKDELAHASFASRGKLDILSNAESLEAPNLMYEPRP